MKRLLLWLSILSLLAIAWPTAALAEDPNTAASIAYTWRVCMIPAGQTACIDSTWTYDARLGRWTSYSKEDRFGSPVVMVYRSNDQVRFEERDLSTGRTRITYAGTLIADRTRAQGDASWTDYTGGRRTGTWRATIDRPPLLPTATPTRAPAPTATPTPAPAQPAATPTPTPAPPPAGPSPSPSSPPLATSPAECFPGGDAQLAFEEIAGIISWGQQSGRTEAEIRADIDTLNSVRGGSGTFTCGLAQIPGVEGGLPPEVSVEPPVVVDPESPPAPV